MPRQFRDEPREDTASQFRTERRRENRDTPRGRYDAQREDFPSQSEFGDAEYVDVFGRQYRFAFRHRLGGWTPGRRVPPLDLARQRVAAALQRGGSVRLWVKVPRQRRGAPSPWYTHDERVSGAPLELEPVQPGFPRQRCVIKSVEQRRSGRTGAVVVTGFAL